MNKLILPVLTIGLFFLDCLTGFAQTETVTIPKKEIKVQRLTLMERYEPDMVLSVEDRLRKKKERYALVEQQRRTIDTLHITDRKKKKLIHMIHYSPYSDRLAKIVDTRFEEGHQ